jgi:hypothetical protein
MNDNLEKPQLHAIQYQFADGIGELCVGFLFILVAVITYLQETMPGSLMNRIFGIASVLLVCGAAFGGRWIIQRIKERITYPRTGYVANKSSWKNKGDIVIGLIMMAVLICFVVFTTVTDTKLADWGPVVCGLFMGTLFVRAGYRLSLPRLYLLAFLGLLIGAGLVISGLSPALSLPLFFGLNGLILFISGSITLWRYLRNNRLPEGTSSKTQEES